MQHRRIIAPRVHYPHDSTDLHLVALVHLKPSEAPKKSMIFPLVLQDQEQAIALEAAGKRDPARNRGGDRLPRGGRDQHFGPALGDQTRAIQVRRDGQDRPAAAQEALVAGKSCSKYGPDRFDNRYDTPARTH